MRNILRGALVTGTLTLIFSAVIAVVIGRDAGILPTSSAATTEQHAVTQLERTFLDQVTISTPPLALDQPRALMLGYGVCQDLADGVRESREYITKVGDRVSPDSYVMTFAESTIFISEARQTICRDMK